MEIILDSYDGKKKYIIRADEYCYEIGRPAMKDGEVVIRKGSVVVPTNTKTFHDSISSCLNSLFEKELRINDVNTLKEFKEHVVKVKGYIKNIKEELSMQNLEG